jgi:uncharacterized protein YeaO (DUF488 family)
MVKDKCVYSPIDRGQDGLRILVTRFRGRGLPKNRCDVWMPNLAPSEKLLRDGQAGKVTWAEFSRMYRAELRDGGSADNRNRLIKNHGQKFTLRLLQALAKRGTVTVMCHCPEDQVHCHRHILRSILSGNI